MYNFKLKWVFSIKCCALDPRLLAHLVWKTWRSKVCLLTVQSLGLKKLLLYEESALMEIFILALGYADKETVGMNSMGLLSGPAFQIRLFVDCWCYFVSSELERHYLNQIKGLQGELTHEKEQHASLTLEIDHKKKYFSLQLSEQENKLKEDLCQLKRVNFTALQILSSATRI